MLVLLDLFGEEVEFHPGPVLLGDASRHWPPGRARPPPAYHGGDVAARAGVLGFATRLRDTAFKRTPATCRSARPSTPRRRGSFGLPDDTSRPLVFIAGGIGITVFRSMLRYIREEQLPTASRSSTRTATSSRPVPRRAPRGSSASCRTSAGADDDAGPRLGRRDGQDRRGVLADHLGDLDRYTYLVAGPPGMTEGVQAALRRTQVRPHHLLALRFLPTTRAR